MLTEKEAKKKWCPFARAVCHEEDGPKGAYNRLRLDESVDVTTEEMCSDTETRCIGSSCMAWRWEHATIEEVFPGEEGDIGRELETDTGYCGLAGPPIEPRVSSVILAGARVAARYKKKNDNNEW
jgi:hypothetical protein